MTGENPESAEGLYFDQESQATYLQDRVPGFDQPFKVTKFLAGQSNPTFRIETAAGNYVLRKKPSGTLLPKAHMVEREFAILKALHDVIPVPRVLDLCEDESVIGQAFFLMDHVDGRILADPGMKDADREEVFHSNRTAAIKLAPAQANLRKGFVGWARRSFWSTLHIRRTSAMPLRRLSMCRGRNRSAASTKTGRI